MRQDVIDRFTKLFYEKHQDKTQKELIDWIMAIKTPNEEERQWLLMVVLTPRDRRIKTPK